MTTATLELYNALVRIGTSKDDGEAMISREEAIDRLASKSDLEGIRGGILDLIEKTTRKKSDRIL